MKNFAFLTSIILMILTMFSCNKPETPRKKKTNTENQVFFKAETQEQEAKSSNSVNKTIEVEQVDFKAEIQETMPNRGSSLFLVECIDTIDPIIANDETTYVIEVTNGITPHRNVKIEAVFPKEVSPTSASGCTICKVNGKRVTVVPYPVLNPKEKIKWKIKAKAVEPGDSRLKVYVTSELLKTIVIEESTHVY